MLLLFFLRLCKLSALVKATFYDYDNAGGVIEGDELSRTEVESEILCALTVKIQMAVKNWFGWVR